MNIKLLRDELKFVTFFLMKAGIADIWTDKCADRVQVKLKEKIANTHTHICIYTYAQRVINTTPITKLFITIREY